MNGDQPRARCRAKRIGLIGGVKILDLRMEIRRIQIDLTGIRNLSHKLGLRAVA